MMIESHLEHVYKRFFIFFKPSIRVVWDTVSSRTMYLMFGGVVECIGRVLVMDWKSMNDYFHFWAKKGAPDLFRTLVVCVVCSIHTIIRVL